LRTVDIVRQAREEIALDEHNSRAWLAYHFALLQRSKKLGRREYEKLTIRTHKRKQTWEEQFVIMQKWAEDQRRAIELKQRLESHKWLMQ
jgi:hypothetical protein